MVVPWQLTATFIGSLILIYAILLVKKGRNKIDPWDLIVHTTTGRLDYKRVALNGCALLQSFTWFRMSMGYPVHDALQDPFMWVVFYAVIAGHDLLGRMVDIKREGVHLHGERNPEVPQPSGDYTTRHYTDPLPPEAPYPPGRMD